MKIKCKKNTKDEYFKDIVISVVTVGVNGKGHDHIYST